MMISKTTIKVQKKIENENLKNNTADVFDNRWFLGEIADANFS